MSFNWSDDFVPRSSKLFYQDTIIYSYNYFTTKSNLSKQFDRESSIGFNYMFTNMFHRLTLLVSGQYRFKAKGATYDYLQNSDTTYATPIESLRSYQSGDVDLSFTKGIGMVPIEAKLTGTYSFDQNSNYIQGILNKIDFAEYATGLSIESNFKKIINGEVGVKIIRSAIPNYSPIRYTKPLLLSG